TWSSSSVPPRRTVTRSSENNAGSPDVIWPWPPPSNLTGKCNHGYNTSAGRREQGVFRSSQSGRRRSMSGMEHRLDREGPGDGPGRGVLLCYRVPREPSAPRIAIWRKLKRLGVAQLGDGLVGLPADARTREQLEWVAEDVTEAGGSAGVWLARPATL